MVVIVLGMPTGDEYRTMLDDGNVAGVKPLPGVIVTQAAGVFGTIATSCEPELVEIRTVLGRLVAPEVSANHGPRRHLDVLSSILPRSSISGSVSGSVSLTRCTIRYLSLLWSLRRTGSICPYPSGFISGLVYAVV